MFNSSSEEELPLKKEDEKKVESPEKKEAE